MIYTMRQLLDICEVKNNRGIHNMVDKTKQITVLHSSQSSFLVETNLSKNELKNLYKKYNFLGKRAKKHL
jgi:hypothetical protein